ncbi:MAG: hypothetical protein JF603_07260 [Acidobacteria bacterium]|nr:hypothetical protein [Acidobacteriota bacterium]
MAVAALVAFGSPGAAVALGGGPTAVEVAATTTTSTTPSTPTATTTSTTTVAMAAAGAAGMAAATPPAPRALAVRYGYDLSWPQCDGPAPPGRGGFVVAGVTGGRPFTRNACLAAQWAWARQSGAHGGLYMNLGAPRVGEAPAMHGPAGSCAASDLGCQGVNFGAAVARDALAHARAAGVDVPMWWLDVEDANYWTADPAVNVMVVRGAVMELSSAGAAAGVYSTPRYWREITGGARLGLPVWVASTTDQLGAPSWCGADKAFTGGEVWLVQALPGQFDANWACDPVARQPRAAFRDLAVASS